jgi:nucleotide-binding universal stress UspA family protein
MVPVDLAHADKLGKALETAADLAKHYGAALHIAGVTSSAPSAVASSPEDFAGHLREFAAEQSQRHGVKFDSSAVTTPDPAVDVDDALQRLIEEQGTDLVVMASHVPGFADYVFASRAGFLASHTSITVMVVR